MVDLSKLICYPDAFFVHSEAVFYRVATTLSDLEKNETIVSEEKVGNHRAFSCNFGLMKCVAVGAVL